MVKIRLARGGAKKKPFYSIIATDSRKPRDSGYIEKLGYFNPVAKGAENRLILNEDKINNWVAKGAQLTERVKQLVKELKDPEIYTKKIAKKEATIAKTAAEAKAKIVAETQAAAKEADKEAKLAAANKDDDAK